METVLQYFLNNQNLIEILIFFSIAVFVILYFEIDESKNRYRIHYLILRSINVVVLNIFFLGIIGLFVPWYFFSDIGFSNYTGWRILWLTISMLISFIITHALQLFFDKIISVLIPRIKSVRL